MLNSVLIEDDPATSFLLSLTMAESTKILASFSDGKYAIEWNGWDQVDVCIVDYNMIGLNGEEVAKWLHENHPHVKVVMTSGNFPRGTELKYAHVYIDKDDIHDHFKKHFGQISGDNDKEK